jgi:hypothetical protein
VGGSLAVGEPEPGPEPEPSSAADDAAGDVEVSPEAGAEGGLEPEASGAGVAEASGDTPTWLFQHPKKLNKADAEALLANHNDSANNDGTFLVRPKPKPKDAAADYVRANHMILSVIFKGTPTHHQLKRAAEGGDWTVNKTPCEGIGTLEALVLHLQTKKKWWPVPLLHPVGGASGDGVAGPAAVDATDGGPPIYQRLSKAAAEDKLINHNGEANDDGTFLIRRKPKSDDDCNYIISVIYNSAPTHHQVNRPNVGADWSVNKKVVEGCTTLAALVAALQTKRKWWPVPLDKPVKKTAE